MIDIQTVIALFIVAAAVVLAVVLVRKRIGGKDCGCGRGGDCSSKKSGGCGSCPMYDKNASGCTDRNDSAKDCGCTKKYFLITRKKIVTLH